MADSTNAERQRRFRAHAKDDHSLCRPGCQDRDQGPKPPRQVYGPRGAAFREAAADAGPVHAALVDETARIIDRLDRLDAAIASKGTWLQFETDDDGRIIVVIDAVLAEARQQAMALKSLVETVAKALPKADEGKPTKSGTLLELADRIAARRAGSA